MTGPVFNRYSFNKIIAFAMLLVVCLIGNKALAADASQAPSFADQVNALMAEYPNGGGEFEAMLTKLALDQPDPAETAATMMVALGNQPSSGALTGVTTVIKKLRPYTLQELRDAIVEAVVAGTIDPIIAANGVLAVVPSLNDDDQKAAGYALGDAVQKLEQQDKVSAASVIKAQVANSKATTLTQSFASRTETTSGTRDNGQPNKTPGDNFDDVGSVPENPPSAS